MESVLRCKYCLEPLTGRVDKQFCTPHCKSSYHYEKNKGKETTMFKKIDDQLKLNRRLLKLYNKSGKSVVRKEDLLNDNFNPNFFTHYWKNNKGDVYLFCYEFGFLSIKEKSKEKFLLIKWQPYMKSKLTVPEN